jgi:RNA polymerase sigma-70 factor (ECF subfamily)
VTILAAVSSSCVLRNPSDRCFARFRRGGDPRDLAAVFDRTAPEVWRVAAHLCRHRHDAEDAVQGTFLAAIEHRDDWDEARPLLPWLLGLLCNRYAAAASPCANPRSGSTWAAVSSVSHR